MSTHELTPFFEYFNLDSTHVRLKLLTRKQLVEKSTLYKNHEPSTLNNFCQLFNLNSTTVSQYIEENLRTCQV